MTQTTEIIFTNLFAMLRNEFFGERNSILPMSEYKCRKLEALRKRIDDEQLYSAAETYSFESNHQERWRKKVYDGERHAIDTSIETMQLLNIVVFNISRIEQGTLSIRGLITMGLYLRQQGHRVDFVKFETWVKQLRIYGMVSLLSSLLIQLFSFAPDEFPFRFKTYPQAFLWAYLQLTDQHKNTPLHRTKSIILFSPIGTLALWKKVTQNALDSIEE